MYDLRALQPLKYCARLWLVVCCLLGAFQVAHAAKLPDFKQTGANVTSNSAKIGMTGNGVEWGSTIPISPVVGGWTYAGNYGIPQAAKGTTMNMSASGDVFIDGTKYPFQAGYTVPASNVWSGLVSAASIVGGMAGGPVGLSILVASTAAPYIKEWFEDSGMRVKPDGSNTIQRGDPYYCGVAPCYEYNGNTYSLQWRANPQTACVEWVNLYSNLYTYVDTQNAGGGNYTCVRKDKGTNVVSGFQLGKRARAVDAIKQWFDMPSMSDIAPYMQAKPFDPRVVPEILAQGGDIPMPAPTVTGPTTLPGPTETIRNADGTTTTRQTQQNYQISGDTITNITNITTTTNYNSSSQVISTSTSTVTPAPNQPTQDYNICRTNPDSVACATKKYLDRMADGIEKIANKPDTAASAPQSPASATQSDCEKHPDWVGCRDIGTPPTEDIPRRTVTLAYTPENHFGGGSCPSNQSMQIQGGPSVVISNWTPICDQITTFVRPLLLVLAARGSLMVLAPGLRDGAA